jgi:hypothetical protein
MKEIIAQLINTANQLDEINQHDVADKITHISTKIANQKLAQDFNSKDFFGNLTNNDSILTDTFFQNEEPNNCQHNNVNYEGAERNEGETHRDCFGRCEECGKEMEGTEVIEGWDDDSGTPEWNVVEWHEAPPMHQLINTANILDERGLNKFADTITKIAQQYQDQNLMQLSDDIGRMFQPTKTNNILAEIKTLLSSLSSLNTNYQRNGDVLIGAGMANYIKEEAQRLLNQLNAEEDDTYQEGPSDEQLDNNFEKHYDNQNLQNQGYPDTDYMGR